MSPKLFVFLLSAAVAFVGAFKLIPPKPFPSEGQADMSEDFQLDDVLAMINEVRSAAVPPDALLQADPELQAWVESQITPGSELSPQVSAEQLLSKLQNQVQGVASASAGVFRAPYDISAFRAEFSEWKEVKEETYTHFAVVIRPKANENLVDVWAVLVQRLHKFEPKLLAKGLQQFHHVCGRCERPYNGQFYGGDRILLLQCPHCETNYDILAVNTKDNYARANTYLSHISPVGAFRPNLSPYEEMITLWHGVLDHCQYENDYNVEEMARAKDAWQTSAETLERGSGDCEDTSILLADWLISRGIEARVVIGETESLQGHAWCIARIDETVYLLETTGEKQDLPRDPPLAKESSDKYHPEYLFDRTHLYFFNGQSDQRAGDCWKESLWHAVDYDRAVPSTAEPTSAAAPWFPSSNTASFVGNVVPAASGVSKDVAGSVSDGKASTSD